jgi:hypothetical protein
MGAAEMRAGSLSSDCRLQQVLRLQISCCIESSGTAVTGRSGDRRVTKLDGITRTVQYSTLREEIGLP